MGFALHNITEGIGIAAPILKVKPPLWVFPALALLAGGPAVIGMWVGSLAYAPQWSALALAIGAGAILQVIVEVSALLMRTGNRGTAALFSPAVLAGLGVGIAFMYGTAMLVKL
jgi:zinc transporter ZupT